MSVAGVGLFLVFFAMPGWGATTTYENLTGSDAITIASGDTGVAQTTNSAFTGNWIVNGTLQSMNGSSQTPDNALGSGTVTLNNGAKLLPGVANTTHLSNPVVINGNVTLGGENMELRFSGPISGSGSISRNTYWSVYLLGDNSAYAGDWNLNTDWTWSLNQWSTPQTGWAGSGDYSFGSGTITLNKGGIAFANGSTDYYVWNDLVVTQAHANFMKGGKSVTLLGKLSGAGNIALQTVGSGSSAVYSTPTVHVRGTENGTFSGNWTINAGYTLTTNNYGSTKETGDSTLGSGQIILNGGTLQTVDTKEYSSNAWLRRISNDIVVNDNSTLSSTANTEMYLFGNISGVGNLTENVTYSLYLRGDNSAYKGNWTLTGDWTWSYNTSASAGDGWAGTGDYSFGSGTVTLNGGGISFASGSTDYYVWNDLVVTQAHANFMKGGKSVTLSGKLTGEGDIQL
ncbi:MAG: hypothetical protein Q4D98_04470 [Planctomycetia bacterium]|nr:hypothetical protein [Planctomycetia bacterium]